MNNKNEIAQYMMKIKPVSPKNIADIDLESFKKIPFASIAGLGGAFASISEKFRTVTNSIKVSGNAPLYMAVDKSGKSIHLTNTLKGQPSMFLGGYIKNGSTAQARFIDVSNSMFSNTSTVAYNPTFMFMGLALAAVDVKLTQIHETNKNILTFLQDDKRAKLKGDFIFLESIVNDYKLNFGDQTYKDNAHVKVLDIRQESEQNIIFFQETLQKQVDKKSFLANNLQIKGQIKNLLSYFDDYRTALFLFGYSSFTEVMLLENFNHDYITSVINKIRERYNKYAEYYNLCREAVQKMTDDGLETNVIGAVAKAGGTLGKLIAKTPLISKTQLDENLIASESKLTEYKGKRSVSIVDKLSYAESNVVEGFVDNLQTIDKLYNDEIQIYLDNENLYWA